MNSHLAAISLVRNQSYGPALDRALARLHINTSKNIVAGRNVTAGYIRSWGLSEEDGFARAIAQDPVYQESMELARGLTLVAEHKLMNLFLIMKYGLAGADGDIVEFGSYKGGSAVFMANVARRLGMKARIYALDTFAGMPETDQERDLHIAGDFNDASLVKLRAFVEEHQLTNLTPVQGLFEDTAPALLEKISAVTLAHIDCDIYPAVKFAVAAVRPKMHPAGGYLAFDDPLQATCLGALEAVEDMIQTIGLHAEQAYPHLVYRYPAPMVRSTDEFDEEAFETAMSKEIELAEARAHIGKIESDLRSKTEMLGDVNKQLKVLGGQFAETSQRLLAMEEQLHIRDMRVDELQERLSKLHASTSWRVTAPLRKLKTALTGR
ncbi:TylF/MycF/NovP-related O-methyltransferase [Paraburkholderia sp. J7]|uniref:TylF/MycF/NovP-related O-methyltransferase n=1 Tax=Paraburkholderia sp. J7 TaxID=2805438 RepID=UPI002AB7738D|nr:TylF/MycF/NovP-related O-methyltransferase [Paraburkholderia sp. J7]